jgi:hypothetical protein
MRNTHGKTQAGRVKVVRANRHKKLLRAKNLTPLDIMFLVCFDKNGRMKND